MPKISQLFREAVIRTLQERGWSYRQATIATGIAYGTIGNMASGMVPTEDNVIKWAVGLKEPINYWLEIAGYDQIPEDLVRDPQATYTVFRIDHTKVTIEVPLGGKELSDEDKQKIAEILQYGSDCVKERKRA